jgi:hypothetical protein
VPEIQLREIPVAVLIGLAGVSFGASAFFFGYYDASVWEPLALAWLCLAFGLVLAGRAMPSRTGMVAVAGLAGLWLWSLLSTRWAESADGAVTDANRWLLYAAVLVALLSLVRTRREARLLTGAATAGVLVVVGYVVVRLLGGDGSSLFSEGRLNQPLNYINGDGTYLLIGFWPLIAVAERARSPFVAAAAAAAAVPVATTVVLTQSRGAIAAFVASAIALFAIVPGRTRRGWALVAVALGLLVAAGPLSDVISGSLPSGASGPPGDDLRRVAVASLLGGALAGVVWGIARAFASELSSRSDPTYARLGRGATVALVVVALVGATAAMLPVHKRVDQIRDQYHAFTNLGGVSGGSRLLSGGGKRYDLWRIGWHQFRDHPVRGIGAGNYDRTYFVERKSDQYVLQAHSIELQTLGETGLVGGAALAAFLGAVLVAFWRTARRRDVTGDPALAVAAGGIFIVWLGHTSVDWMHLIPGLTGIALCAAAALLVAPPAQPSEAMRPLWSRPLVAIPVAIAIAAGAYSIARPALALKLRSDGHDHLASDPVAAIRDAQDSLALDDEPVDTYYLEAAGYARLDLYRQARGTLLEAVRREPHNYVTWALLGDLARRHGDRAAARSAYHRAHQLNPRGEI